MKHAMVILSGGQDSTTCLGWALDNYERVSCVTFDYEQRHHAEILAACMVVEFFERKLNRQIAHEIIDIGNNVFAGSSPLTNPNEQLEQYKNHAQMESVIGDRIEKTFVPMRNAVFLMLAANRAVVAECSALIMGVCEGDNANYPDCREVFIKSADETINLALGKQTLRVIAPLMYLTKGQTVKLALSLPHTYDALAFSHTSYDGMFPPGNDHASVLRAHGFEKVGMPDPLILRAHYAGFLDELPQTPNYNEDLASSQTNLMKADWT